MLLNRRSRRVPSVTPTFCLCVQQRGWTLTLSAREVGGKGSSASPSTCLSILKPFTRKAALDVELFFFAVNWKWKNDWSKSLSNEHCGVYCLLRALKFQAWYFYFRASSMLSGHHGLEDSRIGFTRFLCNKRHIWRRRTVVFFFSSFSFILNSSGSGSGSVGRSKAWACSKETGWTNIAFPATSDIICGCD